MTYTKKQRREIEIAHALKAAKKYLWDGKGGRPGPGKEKYICYAIDTAHSRGECTAYAMDLAQRVVLDRILPNAYIESWLDRRGYPTDSQLDMQTYRHLWLDSLIKEFSK